MTGTAGGVAVAATLSIAAWGCATGGASYVPLDNPNRSLSIRGFSFEPTHGPGWSVMRSDNGVEDGIGSTEVLSVRREHDADATTDGNDAFVRSVFAVAEVSAIDPKAFDWPNERACLEQFIEGESRPASGRFRTVKRTTSWVKRAGLDAAHVDSVTEERDNPEFAGEVLLLEDRTTLIAHPTRSRTILLVKFSQRYPLGTSPLADLADLEDSFFSSIDVH